MSARPRRVAAPLAIAALVVVTTARAEEPAQSWDLLAPLRPFGVETWWDIIHFEPWTGSLGLRYDQQEQRTTGPDGATQRFSSRVGAESITLRNDAISFIDRRLFVASLEAGFGVEQQRQRVGDQALEQKGNLTNYGFDGNFLIESPYNVNVFANQSQNTYVLPSGSTTDSDFRNRGVAFHLRETSLLRDKEILPYFTANARVQQQFDKQTTTSGGQTFRLDDRRDQATFDFQNGGLTSDLSFQYEYTRLENFAYEPGSYASQSANLFYSLDFGPTLNRRWDSRLNWYQRSGRDALSDLTSIDVSEFLTIDHNADLSSTYTYQFTRQETEGGVADTQGAGLQVYKQLYANLSLTGGINGIRVTLPGGTIDTLGGSGSVNYSHRIPLDGQFTIYAGAGYAETESKVPSGLAPVVDAPYTVPQDLGAGTAILLKDRNIVANTLIVVVVKGGARVPALLDIDYSVRIDGDRTSLVPFASSAVMLPGDVLNVSYSYAVSSDSKFATTSRSATLAMDWQPVGFSVSHDESDQKPISGTDSLLLVEQRKDVGQVYVRGAWEDTDARLTAALTRYDSDRLAYIERRFDAYGSWRIGPGVQLNLSANQYHTEYDIPVHTTDGRSIRLDFTWNRDAWLTNGYGAIRWYDDTQQPPEKVEELGMRIRRTWTKLDLSIALGAQKRTRGEVSQLNGYFHFGAVRRF